MAGVCVFCGASGALTGEHVLGDWLTTIGLPMDEVAHGAGWLNLMDRPMGVSQPFRRTVNDVCGPCNNGWMSDLEAIAKRVLTSLILGDPGAIEASDRGAVAAWFQKTALVAMLVSTEEDRARGYGLPASEYQELYERRATQEPLPATQVWIGRYEGEGRTGSTWVVPQVVAMDGLPELDTPQAYAMTLVLGQLVLHGVRFTTTEFHIDLATERDMPCLWPGDGPVAWPEGKPVSEDFLRFSAGKELRSLQPGVEIRPWKAATDLVSHRVGSMVELPTICGKHVAYYPQVLIDEARRRRFYVFWTGCECGLGYLVETQDDGAHIKKGGPPAAIEQIYNSLSGDEYVHEDENGRFACKAL
jgi:hypothetical protein